MFWCALDTTTSGIKGSHTPIRGLVPSILSLQHEICVLQATTKHCGNLATRLQVGLLCSMTQLSPLSGWPRRSTDEAMMRYTLAANFASGMGPCMGIVEPFKHLLCVTAHPHFLALELRVPMGACLGQYGMCSWQNGTRCRDGVYQANRGLGPAVLRGLPKLSLRILTLTNYRISSIRHHPRIVATQSGALSEINGTLK